MEARSMDKLSVHHGHHNGGGISKPCHGGKGGGGGGGRASRGGGGKGIKVVYISSPMNLTASAEEFRAVVQELTGRDSNVADHDLAHQQQRYRSSSSFGRASMMPVAAAGVIPRSMPPTMATANAAGAGRMMMAADAGGAAGIVATAAPMPFQSAYDQGSLLYGQDYW